MKLITKLSLACIALIVSSQSMAASDDECAIWLCLPYGFASQGCGGPFLAMKKRQLTFQKALPPIWECGGDKSDKTNYKIYDASLMNSDDPTDIEIKPGKCKDLDGNQMADSSNREGQCKATVHAYELSSDGEKVGGTYYLSQTGGSDFIEDEETGNISEVIQQK